ncbi:MAG: hypothetical protein GEU91_07925 [Rhizobiales bacterium]|nr:hypothetical protein [Hyphomicrobiales bacterium]
MIRSYIVCVAVLFGLAIMPAGAADPPLSRPFYGEAPPAAEWWIASPYYVVNHGPELSGPGIVITEIGFTNTDLKRSYPFIGTVDDLTPVVVPAGHYGDPVLSARAQARMPGPRVRPAVAWRKPAKARGAR